MASNLTADETSPSHPRPAADEQAPAGGEASAADDASVGSGAKSGDSSPAPRAPPANGDADECPACRGSHRKHTCGRSGWGHTPRPDTCASGKRKRVRPSPSAGFKSARLSERARPTEARSPVRSPTWLAPSRSWSGRHAHGSTHSSTRGRRKRRTDISPIRADVGVRAAVSKRTEPAPLALAALLCVCGFGSPCPCGHAPRRTDRSATVANSEKKVRPCPLFLLAPPRRRLPTVSHF